MMHKLLKVSIQNFKISPNQSQNCLEQAINFISESTCSLILIIVKKRLDKFS